MFDDPARNYLLVFLTICVCFSAADAQAAPLRPLTTIGDWSLFCAKGTDQPKMSDCAIAGGTVSEQDANLWVRLGLAFDPEGKNAKMVIRIPLTDYINQRKGIFLSTESEKIGRVFIDSCDKGEGVCRATVGMVARNFSAILSARTLNVQFQSERDRGVSLTVAMGGFLPVFEELQKKIGMKKRTAEGYEMAGLFGPNASAYSLTFASPEKTAEKQVTSDPNSRVARNCLVAAETFLVKSNDVRLSEALAKWLAAAGKCPEGRIVMIGAEIARDDDTKNEPNFYDIANINKLARLVSDNTPSQRLDLVYRELDGPPLQISAPR